LENRVPARLTPKEGRKFGLTVGGAFAVLAAISWWRGHRIPVEIFGGLATLLILAALVIPGQLGPVNRAWMGLAEAISKVTTPIFMGVVWFIVITPTAFIRRALGKNQIARDLKAPTFWVSREAGQRRGDLERQF